MIWHPKKGRARWPSAVLAVVLLGPAGLVAGPGQPAYAAAPPTYALTTLHAVTGEVFTANTGTNGVNGAGLVAGSVRGHENDQYEAAVFDTRTSTVRHLGSLVKGQNSYAVDVNVHGDVVGTSYLSSSREHAFVVPAATGTMIDLGAAEPTLDSGAGAINDHGVVTGGVSDTAKPLPHNYAVIWTPGSGTAYTEDNIGKAVGSTESGAGAINNGGYALLGRWDKWQDWAFVWIPEHRFALQVRPLPGDDNVRVSDLNDAGFVVGESYDHKTGVEHPILWDAKTRVTRRLPELPGGLPAIPRAINAHGTIVGWGLVVQDGATLTKPVVWDDYGAGIAVLPTGAESQGRAFSINVYGLVAGQPGNGLDDGAVSWKPATAKTAVR